MNKVWTWADNGEFGKMKGEHPESRGISQPLCSHLHLWGSFMGAATATCLLARLPPFNQASPCQLALIDYEAFDPDRD